MAAAGGRALPRRLQREQPSRLDPLGWQLLPPPPWHRFQRRATTDFKDYRNWATLKFYRLGMFVQGIKRKGASRHTNTDTKVGGPPCATTLTCHARAAKEQA